MIFGIPTSMDAEATKVAERLLNLFKEKGFEQRNSWQEYNISTHANTRGWITTIHHETSGKQYSVWLPVQCDQYNLFDWSDAQVLDLP